MGLAKFILMLLILLDVQKGLCSSEWNVSVIQHTHEQSRYQEIQTVHKEPAACNATVRKVEETSLKFSKLLVEKMTQLVQLKLLSNYSKGELVNTDDISLYWVNNEIGETILNLRLSRLMKYEWLKHIDTCMKRHEEFIIPVELEESKRNASCLAKLLKNVFKQLEFLETKTDPKVICVVDVILQTKAVVCYKQTQSIKMSGAHSTRIYLYEVHWSMWTMLIFGFLLTSYIFERISAFLDSQIYRKDTSSMRNLLFMSVPHNVIICKIMKWLLFWHGVIPKCLFLVACIICLIVRGKSLSKLCKVVYSLSFFIAFALPPSFCYRYFFKPEIQVGRFRCSKKLLCLCAKLFVRFLVCRLFTFSNYLIRGDRKTTYFFLSINETKWRIKLCEKTDHGNEGSCDCQLIWSNYIFVEALIGFVLNICLLCVITSLAEPVIIVFEYTLLCLLLNADYFFPLISFFTIVTIYISKSFQSFCEIYSSLLIDVDVLQENDEDKSAWTVKEDDYEHVRKIIEPYSKNLLILIAKVVSIIMFASLVHHHVEFLRKHTKASFDVKMVVLFGFTALPYLLNILFWDQSENEKEAAEKHRRRKIEDILSKRTACMTSNPGSRHRITINQTSNSSRNL